MKTLLLVLFLALPMHAQFVAGVRAGGYQGQFVGTAEVELRHGNWSVAPALDVIRGGYDLHAIHVDLRRLFPFEHTMLWIGAGPTFVRSNMPASDNTWNVDAGLALRMKSAWEPYIAARYYTYDMPVFRDEIKGTGGVISIGISRRF
jgi:hypothetical protein